MSRLQDNGKKRRLDFYRSMVTIRRFEDQVNQLYLAGKMPGLAHLCSGQEAVAVGVCANLGDKDYITSTHRGHGHALAKGARVDLMFAELLGKAAGYCAGKGGSMHIADQERGNLGANAIVGGSAGIAAGAALSAKMRRSGQVVVSFFGEGAMNQGLVHETMNMASLWQLPLVYVCENNLYNEYTPFREVTAGSLLQRAEAMAIPVHEGDGQDLAHVYESSAEAIERARQGGGPTFVMYNTYRYSGHHVGDINRDYYRSREEEQEWRERRDPIAIEAERLVAEGVADRAELDAIAAEAERTVAEGARFAIEAPYPAPSEVDRNVYA